MTNIITSFEQISERYNAVFCDLWGCLHNGIFPFPAAVKALAKFRDTGGTVVLLTNSPRPSNSVYSQLDEIGVPRDLYHGIVSSGDAARAAMASGNYGKRVYHLGPQRDTGFFQGIETEDFYQGVDVERVPLEDADGIVCTGLFDDATETPEDYRELFVKAKTLGLRMLCANPDVVVDRGDTRIYCAGALAEAYRDMGGEAHYFGKPHAPIYDLAHNRLTSTTGQIIDDTKILCLGDGINTDIKGAVAEGMDSLFITGGLAARDTMVGSAIQLDRLEQFFASAQLTPTYSIVHLQ
jgi:HAD superfamily hydrolase (TIGR01459 family)